MHRKERRCVETRSLQRQRQANTTTETRERKACRRATQLYATARREQPEKTRPCWEMSEDSCDDVCVPVYDIYVTRRREKDDVFGVSLVSLLCLFVVCLVIEEVLACHDNGSSRRGISQLTNRSTKILYSSTSKTIVKRVATQADGRGSGEQSPISIERGKNVTPASPSSVVGRKGSSGPCQNYCRESLQVQP